MDYPIPANDDATKSIELILDVMLAAINEGVEERKNDKTAVDEVTEEGGEEGQEPAAPRERRSRVTKVAAEIPEDGEIAALEGSADTEENTAAEGSTEADEVPNEPVATAEDNTDEVPNEPVATTEDNTDEAR